MAGFDPQVQACYKKCSSCPDCPRKRAQMPDVASQLDHSGALHKLDADLSRYLSGTVEPSDQTLKALHQLRTKIEELESTVARARSASYKRQRQEDFDSDATPDGVVRARYRSLPGLADLSEKRPAIADETQPLRTPEEDVVMVTPQQWFAALKWKLDVVCANAW